MAKKTVESLIVDEIKDIKERLERIEGKIGDLNLILKVFKWIGWALTIAGAWLITNFLSGWFKS